MCAICRPTLKYKEGVCVTKTEQLFHDLNMRLFFVICLQALFPKHIFFSFTFFTTLMWHQNQTNRWNKKKKQKIHSRYISAYIYMYIYNIHIYINIFFTCYNQPPRLRHNWTSNWGKNKYRSLHCSICHIQI